MPAMIRTSGHMWGPDGDEARHPRRHPRQQLRRHLPGRHRRLPGQRRLRPGHHGLGAQRRPDGAGGRGVRLATTRPSRSRPPAPSASSTRPATSCSSTTVGAGDIWRDVPDQGRPDPRLGQARRHPGPRHRRPGGVLARREPRPRRQPDRQGRAPTCPSTTPTGLDIQIMAPVDAIALLARADPQGRGHHLGHRQRAARLPDRPVPDPGARHQRQDALGGAADQRRRPVRDRRRRLGPQARAAAGQGELPALGQPGRVPRPRASASSTSRRRPATRARRSWPTPSTGRPARSSTRTSRRLAGSARSTTGAATSTWRSTGPRSWPRRPTTPSWRPTSPRSPRRSPATRRAITGELLAVQGSPVDIGGYYRPDAAKVDAVMRPSKTLNEALASLG